MNQLLSIGDTLRDDVSGQRLEIVEHLGSGSQGEVYRVRMGNADFALKWYFQAAATEAQAAAIQALVRKGSPSPCFLWPLALISASNVNGFGYLMGLRAFGYRNLRELVKRSVVVDFETRMTIGFELAQNFLLLHSRGLCYRDISLGNVFFEPATGSVLICDTDNVGIDGASDSGVLGTPKFMAPEIVRGEDPPSAATDLYSLAVLLFYLMMVAHPLDGAREASIHSMDEPARRHLYGTEPIFVFDPGDGSNRPVPGIHDNALTHWPIYPQFLRDLFTQSFTVGMTDPHRRVRESEWRVALIRARDLVAECPSCGAQVLYDIPTFIKSGTLNGCWSCHTTLTPGSWLDSGTAIIAIRPGARIYPHHMSVQSRWDFSAPLAEIAQHPSQPGRYGLRNTPGRPLVATKPDGTEIEVPSGRAVDLSPGLRLDFGSGLVVVESADDPAEIAAETAVGAVPTLPPGAPTGTAS